MKTSIIALPIAVLLSACGGGGGSSGNAAGSTSNASAPPAQLAAYLGTWASDCDDHAIDTAVISRPAGSTDSITISVKTDFYVNANCTGNIVGTFSQSADATGTYAGTVSASVVLNPGTAATTVSVDKVTASLPQHTVSVTGTGVTHTTVNGQPQWCIAYGGGSSVCIKDEGTYAAQTGVAGGLTLQGNTFYELTLNGSTYTSNERFTKK